MIIVMLSEPCVKGWSICQARGATQMSHMNAEVWAQGNADYIHELWLFETIRNSCFLLLEET